MAYTSTNSVDQRLETLLAHVVLEVETLLHEPDPIRDILTGKIEQFVTHMCEIIDRTIHPRANDELPINIIRSLDSDPNMPSSAYIADYESREPFVSELSPFPLHHTSDQHLCLEQTVSTQPAKASGGKRIHSSSNSPQNICAQTSNKRRKRNSDDAPSRVDHLLRLDGIASTRNPVTFLVALDMSWFLKVRSGMSRALEGQDAACLELLIQCFLTIGSPHAFEQLRKALPTCRGPRCPMGRNDDLGNIMIELERNGAHVVALDLRRRLKILSLRKRHKETIASLPRCIRNGQRAAPASLEILVGEVVVFKNSQDPRTQELLGDETSIRSKIEKYLALARNWETMSSDGYAALLLLLLTDGDLFDFSVSKIEKLSSDAFRVLLEALQLYRGEFLSKVCQRLMPELQDVIEGRSTVLFKFETCDISELRQMTLDSDGLLQLCCPSA